MRESLSLARFCGVLMLCLCVSFAWWGCDGQVSTGENQQEAGVEQGGQEKTSLEGIADANAEGTPEVTAEATQPEATQEAVQPEAQPEPPQPEAQPEPPQPEAVQEPTPPERQPEAQPEPQPEQPVTGVDYSKDGPMTVATLPRRDITLPTATGCKGDFCTIFVEASYPNTGSIAGPYPLVIFSNGFLLQSSRYASYAQRLASWGYVVIRWDTNGEDPTPIIGKGVIDHDALGKMIIELIKWVEGIAQSPNSPLSGKLDASNIYLVGHSRGGKASAFATPLDNRIKAFFGIDPVNSDPPLSSRRIDSLPELAKSSALVAVVGSDKNTGGFQPCTPPQHNFSKFYDAAPRAAWEMQITESGHMQFLDNTSGCGFTCSACTDGSTPRARVLELTQTMMIAWGERVFRNADISRYLNGAWQQQLTQSNQAKFRSK